MPLTYEESLSYLGSWLKICGLENLIASVIIEQGYDDFEALSHCTENEVKVFVECFPPQTQFQVEYLLNSLRDLKVDGYIEHGIKAPPEKPLPEAPAKQSGFLSLKIKGSDDWQDKHCKFENSVMFWFKSRKAKDPEGSLNATEPTISDCEITVSKNEMKLVTTSLGIVEFQCEDEDDFKEWLPVFQYFKDNTEYLKAVEGTILSPSYKRPNITKKLTSSFEKVTISEQKKPPQSSESNVQSSESGRIESFKKPASINKTQRPKKLPSFSDTTSADANNNGGIPKKKPPPPPKNVARKVTAAEIAEEKETVRMKQILTSGHQFKKYKRGKSNVRWIWSDAGLNTLCWGTEEMNLIKGFLKTREITNIRGDESKLMLYIDGASRTLELEAKTKIIYEDWFKALFWLKGETDKVIAYERNVLFQNPDFVSKLRKDHDQYLQLLVKGNEFFKYKGSSMHRRIIRFTDAVNEVIWCDPKKPNKPKGSILLEDMAFTTGQESVGETFTRFVIWAKERSLMLEADNFETKDLWCRAVNHFIRHGLTPAWYPS